MEILFFLLIAIALVVWLVIGPAVALAKVSQLRRRVEELERKMLE